MKRTGSRLSSLAIMTISMLAFALLVLFTLRFCSSQIESDTQEASLKELRGKDMPWASVAVHGKQVRLTGTAPTEEAAHLAEQVLAELWPDAVINNATQIAEPVQPYTFEARYDGQTIELHGYVRNRETRRMILQPVRMQVGSALINLQMREGQPADWERAIPKLLDSLTRMRSGRLTVKDQRVVIQGDAGSAGLKRRLLAELNELQTMGYQVKADITAPPPPPSCEAQLDAATQLGTIEFESGGATLQPASYPILTRIAKILRSCFKMDLVVAGHTDSRGQRDANLLLSQQRADAVKDYLVSLGVPAERIFARGYGEDEPIASNRTEVGRARNRRIEFMLVPKQGRTPPADAQTS